MKNSINLSKVYSGVTLPFGAPCSFFAAPTNFLLSPKKKKKKEKVATFFSVFLIGFLPPWSFLYPQIFFSRRPNAKLADIWYIFLLCQKIFRYKKCKFGNMPPPKIPIISSETPIFLNLTVVWYTIKGLREIKV